MYATMYASSHETQLSTLRRYFGEAWNDSREHALPDGRAGSTRRRIAVQCCPIGVLQDSLLRLLAENYERPASDLRPQVRCMIADRDFAGDTGDEPMDPHHDYLIDRYTIAITDALEHVRRRAIDDGIWSSEPVTPQMFG